MLFAGGSVLTPQKRRHIIAGIYKLYKGSLKAWHSLLPAQGRVVIVVPEFHIRGAAYMPAFIDTCENLGYNKLEQVPYAKPGATIIRNITILEKI